jgi:L-threonylcarbamoyladenylate synthase
MAENLAERFWPGPLTMIVSRGGAISPLVSAGRTTVALRCPNHPVAQELLKAFGGPIAAPSANRSGFTSPTTAQHVMAELSGRVPLILDGGPCAVGVESTVVDLTRDVPQVLRPGAVTLEMLRDVMGAVDAPVMRMAQGAEAASPGMYDRHYAPRTPAYIFTRHEWSRCGGGVPKLVRMLAGDQGKAVLITHDPRMTLEPPHEVILLPEDAAGYARVLYGAIRQADEAGGSTILILLPDTTQGLWAAVVDRLGRAAVRLPVM